VFHPIPHIILLRVKCTSTSTSIDTMAINRFNAPLIFSASALSCYCLFAPVAKARQLRRFPAPRLLKEDHEDTSPDSDGLEIHCSSTPRNKKILADAVGLRIKPWGFSNNHFASILAQIRPSPFTLRWGSATRRVSKGYSF